MPIPDSDCINCNCENKYKKNVNFMNKVMLCPRNNYKIPLLGELLFCISLASLVVLNKKTYKYIYNN